MEPNENNRAKPNIKIKNRITNNSIGTDLKKNWKRMKIKKLEPNVKKWKE